MTDLDPDLEELALDCLARLETDGENAIEAACARHPEHALKLRGMVRQLRKMGLVADRGERAPERIGDYRLLRRLGSGGMGVVHLAEDERLGRKVALKLMRGAFLAGEHSRDRFRREVEALAKLDHPGICTVFEAGDHDGVPFLAMRYVEGESLRVRIRRWRESELGNESNNDARSTRAQRVAEAVACVEKTARAVHAAHEHGVVHRDLKPDNVVVDPEGQPVVLDFGLARLLDAAQPTLTGSGELIGTPAYMAPEQVAGGHGFDERTDVYGLGALLYECVTLRLPFTDTHREALYRRILSEEPPTPHTRDSQVGRDLSAVIGKAMEKDPRRRYATAAELANELGHVLRGEAVRARHPGPVARALRWSRRNRAAAGALVVVSLALVASLVLLLERNTAVRQFQVAAVLRLADEVRDDDPLLAYQYAREALWLDTEARQPAVVARLQELLFELPDVNEIGRRDGTVTRVLWSPDSKSVLATGPTVCAALLDVDGSLLHDFGHLTMHAAWHPRGNQLALVSADQHAVERYRIRAGQVVALPATPRHEDMIVGLAWADDGRLLVSRKRGARLWRTDGTSVELSHSGEGEFWQGVFLSDGRVVAAGAIWSADGDRSEPLNWTGYGDHVYRVVSGADIFVTGLGRSARTRRAVFWSRDGRCLEQIDAPQSSELSVFSVSADGRRALVASGNGAVWLRTKEGGLVRWHMPDTRGVTAARFRRGGILLSDFGGAVRELDEDFRLVATQRVRGALSDLAVDPNDPTRFLTAGVDGVVRLWRMGGRAEAPAWADVENASVAVDRDRVLVAGANGRVWLLDAEGRLLADREIPEGHAFPAFAPDGTPVLACQDGALRILDLQRDELRERCRVPGMCEQPVQFGGDSIFVRADRVGYRCSLHGDDDPVPLPLAPCQSLAVTRDGGTLFSGTWDGQVLSIPLPRGQPRTTIGRTETPLPIIALAVSADESRLLAGCADGNAYLWDLRTNRTLAVLRGHRHAVRDVAFGPDGRTIATVAMDDHVRLFDLPPDGAPRDLSPRLTVRHHLATQARFLGPDRLVTAGARSVRFWALTRGELLAREPAFGVPQLTEGEKLDLERRLLGRESR